MEGHTLMGFASSSQLNRFTYNNLEYEILTNSKKETIEPEMRDRLGIHFYSLIQRVGKVLKIKQEVICTAAVYFKRFYLKNEYSMLNPYLMVCVSVYLACKAEETPIHLRLVLKESRAIVEEVTRGMVNFEFTNQDVAECEAYLLEEMEFYLIVYHPFEFLSRYSRDMGVDKNTLQAAWFMVNDLYSTDAPLLYSPHHIAAACLFVALTTSSSDKTIETDTYFEQLGIDFELIIQISNLLLKTAITKKDFKDSMAVEYTSKIVLGN